jgi:class 3 adenylate cyclase
VEPQVQYARTVDGENIAFWDIGQGVPCVMPPLAMPWSHVSLEWQMPEWRAWYELLSQHARVIRFDLRGMGLSSGAVPENPLDVLQDFDAVLDKTGVQDAVIFGCYYASPLAIAYAATRPERVSHLVTWCGFSRSDEGRDPAVGDAIDGLMERYELFTETIAHTVFGWSSGESGHQLALYFQRSMPLERLRAYWAIGSKLDADDKLADVKAKTMIVHRREFPLVKVEVAQKLAASIADSRLVVLEGASLSPFTGDVEETIGIIGDFLADHPQADESLIGPHAHVTATPAQPAFRTIMFTDITESTKNTQRFGDERAQELVRAHDGIVRDSLRRYGGTEIKHTGDGIMASFATSSSALESAVAIQRAVEARKRESPSADELSVHIGVNAGEPVAEGSDLFGTAVQLARRICDHASEHEILVADVVRQLAAGKNFLFAERGETALRGFEDPVLLYELRWREG